MRQLIKLSFGKDKSKAFLKTFALQTIIDICLFAQTRANRAYL